MNSNQLGKHFAQNRLDEEEATRLLSEYGQEIYSKAYIKGYIDRLRDMERIRVCRDKRLLREHDARVEKLEDAKTDGKRKV